MRCSSALQQPAEQHLILAVVLVPRVHFDCWLPRLFCHTAQQPFRDAGRRILGVGYKDRNLECKKNERSTFKNLFLTF